MFRTWGAGPPKEKEKKRERDTLATVAQTCVKVHIRRPLEQRDSLVYSKADEKLMMDKAGCTLCRSTSRSVCPVTIELSIDKTQQLSVPQKTLSLSLSLSLPLSLTRSFYFSPLFTFLSVLPLLAHAISCPGPA